MTAQFTSRRKALVPAQQVPMPLCRPTGEFRRLATWAWNVLPSLSEWAAFCACTTLTVVGFFVEAVPFAVAYLPFLFAILIDQFGFKFWSVAGHFTWLMVISAWGLIQLGHNPLHIVPIGILAVVIISGVTAWGSVGLVGLFLSAIPFFPGSPFLITGSILPGWGIWAYFVLIPVLIFIELHRVLAARVAYLVLLGIFAATLHLTEFKKQHILHGVAGPVRYPTPRPIDLSDIQAVTRLGYWDAIASRTPNGATVILGENIFHNTDRVGWSYWCRLAKHKNATLYIGVQGEDSIGEVWKFDTEACPTPGRIYQAQIGVPGVTGGWTPNVADWEIWHAPNKTPQWLICFEAFSMVRWVGVGFSGASHTIIISNDKWTEPLPVSLLRRKVGREFEKLFGVSTVYAETERNMLIIPADHTTRP